MKKYFPFLAFFFLLIFCLSLQLIVDTDFGWHLKAGEYIVNTHQIPKHDLFSFTLPNYPYVYHSWAGEVVTYLSYQIGGLYGVSLAWAALFTTTFFLIFKTCQLTSKNHINYIFLTWAALASYPETGRGMRVFGFLFLSLIYYLYQKYQLQKSKHIWFVPPIFLLWANFHGSFIVGIFVFFLLALKTRSLFPQLALSVIFSVVNPYGIHVWIQAIQMLTNSQSLGLQNINRDWQPLLVTSPSAWIIVAIVLAFSIGAKLKKIKNSNFSNLLILLFLAATIVQSRFIFVLFVLFIPLANQTLEILLAKIRKIQKVLPIRLAYLALLTIPPLLAIANIFETSIAYKNLESFANYTSNKFTKKISVDIFPYKANLNLENTSDLRVLTDASSSGFLLLQKPKVKLFFYGAMDNFIVDNRSFVYEYLSLIETQSNWQEKLQKYKVNAVVLPPSYSLSNALKKETSWNLIYEDQSAVVFFKKP